MAYTRSEATLQTPATGAHPGCRPIARDVWMEGVARWVRAVEESATNRLPRHPFPAEAMEVE